MKALLTCTDFARNLRWHTDEIVSGEPDFIHQVSVYPAVRHQVFHGFGGAFTEAAAFNYQKLPPDRQKAFMECCFGKEGLCYTQGRVHMGSCDFSLGNYSCMESQEDSFAADRDDQYLIPMIRTAGETAGKPVELMLSPWSPPAFMKSNGDRNHGGSLMPEYRELWAECMVKYVKYYRSQGLNVRRITVQNEPAAVQTWDSCIYSGKEEGEFAVKFLAHALKEADCGDVQILAWDHNKEMLPYRADAVMSVSGAVDAVSGFAFHWYTGDHFSALSAVRQLYPQKELWFSEGCVEYSRFEGFDSIRKAEMYAHDIIGNLNAGANGSLDWNLLLDSKGGPNHVGNFCEAPIMLCESETDFELRSEFYYIGQFSRFLKPGAVRLESSVYSADVEAAAFENPDGSRIVVSLNRTDENKEVCVTMDGRQGYHYCLNAHSIATLQI